MWSSRLRIRALDLPFLLASILAFCVHAQGGFHKPPPSITEPQSSGFGVEAVSAKTRSIRMYYAFSGGGATCRDFWQASGPKQTQPPVTAWRQAFRKTVESGIQLSEVSAEVASISVACNDPAPEFFTNLRRVSLTVQLAPDLTIKDYICSSHGSEVALSHPAEQVLLGTYTKDSLFNTFVGTFVGIAGAGSPFQPIHMEYKAQDIFYICPVGFGGCAPYRYDPTLANYQSS